MCINVLVHRPANDLYFTSLLGQPSCWYIYALCGCESSKSVSAALTASTTSLCFFSLFSLFFFLSQRFREGFPAIKLRSKTHTFAISHTQLDGQHLPFSSLPVNWQIWWRRRLIDRLLSRLEKPCEKKRVEAKCLGDVVSQEHVGMCVGAFEHCSRTPGDASAAL